MPSLSCDQRKRLAIVGQHVFDFHRVGADLDDSVAPVDDLPFLRYEDVLALGEEYLFRSALIASEPVELERNRRWRRWRWRPRINHLLHGLRNRHGFRL